MSTLTRRQFIQSSVAAVTVLSGSSIIAADKPKRSATDLVELGKSGLKVTRLGMGTGSNSGHIQMALGQKEFTKVVRHAYDRGIRFFDTANGYGDGKMQSMLAEALKGIDRSTYVIQTKTDFAPDGDPMKEIDRFRQEWNTDYFDLFLMHYMTSEKWPEEHKKVMDKLSEIKEKKIIHSKGASIHGLKSLRAMAACHWMDTALLRVNHSGYYMDNEPNDTEKPGELDVCLKNIKAIHDGGTGVIGMKLIGNGTFTDAAVRDASIKFVMGLDYVDAAIIGFKSTEEVDEAIERINKHLNA